MSQCVSCDHDKDDQWFLCERCQRLATKQLGEIPQLHAALSRDPWLLVPDKVEHERPNRSPSRGVPINLHAVSLIDKRTDVRSILRPWIEDVHERISASAKIPADVPGLCDRMLHLLPWCAEHLPAVSDLLDEIHQQHSALKRIVIGSRRPPSPVPCPVILPDEGACRGILLLENDGTVRCRSCDSIWRFEDWRRLGGLLASG
jgi:hypothetical protein